MYHPQISNDDVTDIMEMAQKIEDYIKEIVKDNDKNIAISALISGSVNSIMSQCNSINETILYRNFLVQTMDMAIKCAQEKE